MRKRLSVVSLVVILGLVLMGFSISPALAAPASTGAALSVQSAEVSFTGRALSIYGQSRTVEVEVDGPDGQSTHYTVHVPDNFDLGSLHAGDTIGVKGKLGEDDLVEATKVVKQDPPSEPTAKPKAAPSRSDSKGNIFCQNEALGHPVAAAIAKTYDLDEEDVMAWFCEDNVGIGQIVLALQTAKGAIQAGEADEDELYDLADSYLSRRSDGEGWGQIWQGLSRLKLALKAKPVLKDKPAPKVTGWLDKLNNALKSTGLGNLKDKAKGKANANAMGKGQDKKQD